MHVHILTAVSGLSELNKNTEEAHEVSREKWYRGLKDGEGIGEEELAGTFNQKYVNIISIFYNKIEHCVANKSKVYNWA